jgi:two-component system, OmpR family, response regulator
MAAVATVRVCAPGRPRGRTGPRCRCGHHSFVPGEGVGGHVGQQTGGGNRGTDHHAVQGPEAAQPGVTAGNTRWTLVAAHEIRLCPCSLNRESSLDENLLDPVCRGKGSYDERVANIVLIEDEPGIVDFIDRGLSARGFEVRSALDGENGLELALGDHVDLVVLDLMLPGRSGMEVLADLAAERPGLPVIVLTARGEVEDRVGGLNAGAVDYLVKPFALAELEARIRAQLRAARQAPPTVMRNGELEINLLTREVRSGGEIVRLTNTEFDLLAYFMNHPGQVLNRQQILRAVWGYGHDPATNIVDVYIGYLRRKLATGGRQVPIVTVRSRGYRLEEDTG